MMITRPHPNIATRVEEYAKIGGIIIAGCYILGLVIVNFYLSTLHIKDFTIVRACNVLTGLSYLIYMLTPVAPPLAAIIISRKLAKKKYATVLISIIITTFLFWSIPFAFEYFISSIDPMARSGNLTVWSIQCEFWHLYHSPILIGLIAWILPCWLIFASYWFNCCPYLTTIRPFLALIAAISFVSQIVSYSCGVHPNISAAMGGGQPQLVSLLLKSDSTTSDRSATPAASHAQNRDAIIWHSDETFYYINYFEDFPRTKPAHAGIIAVRRDMVLGWVNLDATMVNNFSNDKITRTIVRTDLAPSECHSRTNLEHQATSAH